MSSFTHLIIGLGNPGEEYARTRHNIGFMAVDEIAVRSGATPWKKKFRGLVSSSKNFLLLKPLTYMNLSGESAIEALQFYELKPEQSIVFHDDLDLLPGQVKIKQGGGAGGHNGLKSLDTHIGPNYWRVRLGIGRPMTEQGEPVKGDAVTNYVLNPFAKSDKAWLEPLIDKLAGECDLLLAGNHKDYLAALPKAAS
ncbi:MAG: aminoacyl-tRNA hydrolase [Alphaproteobacteria bacterium]|nr:aminoacyl-tRNA hydrolase [Alphaproteobacteria bacterium]